MIRFCTVSNKETNILFKVKSKSNFYIKEAEKLLQKKYPEHNIKCFIKKENAEKRLYKNIEVEK